MRYPRTCLIVLMLWGAAIAPGQERRHSVTAFGTFTTSSKLFPNPNDADEFTRGQFLPLDDIFSFGVEFRREISSIRLQVGLGVEYIGASSLINVPASGTTIQVRDGFRAVPIELTGYFVIPFSGDLIHLFMGAGAGVYPGVRTYEYAGVDAVLVEQSTGAGIHVVSGIEYAFNELISIRSVVKFRDVQFESVHRFTQATAAYNGTVVSLSQDPFASRINIDGMVTTVGIAVRF